MLEEVVERTESLKEELRRKLKASEDAQKIRLVIHNYGEGKLCQCHPLNAFNRIFKYSYSAAEQHERRSTDFEQENAAQEEAADEQWDAEAFEKARPKATQRKTQGELINDHLYPM